MTSFKDELNRENFLRFLSWWDSNDWIPLIAVQDIFSATEDAVVRLVYYCWMRDELELPDELGVYYVFRLVVVVTEPVQPPASDAAIEELLAYYASITPEMIEQICGCCYEVFLTERKTLMREVCPDCIQSWRMKYAPNSV